MATHFSIRKEFAAQKLILFMLICLDGSSVDAQVPFPPKEEVKALGEIADQLGKRDWNFTLNPCDNKTNWASDKNNMVKCDNCTADECHVTHIRGGQGASCGRGHSSTTLQGDSASSLVVCYCCGYSYYKENNCWAPDDAIKPPTQAFNASYVASLPDQQWYLDTGATHHMSPDDEQLHSKAPYLGTDCVLVGNGVSLPITHIASTLFSLSNGSSLSSKVLCVPTLAKKL